jgi:hypothetical protein
MIVGARLEPTVVFPNTRQNCYRLSQLGNKDYTSNAIDGNANSVTMRDRVY